ETASWPWRVNCFRRVQGHEPRSNPGMDLEVSLRRSRHGAAGKEVRKAQALGSAARKKLLIHSANEKPNAAPRRETMKLESLKDFYFEQTQLLDAVPRIVGVAFSYV
ncbi:MAG TPA: hypothetical protein VFR31_20670, partial [Thermoanaerobaculia bacterium]|nr:hypothetical protein [Thermoanaerobaculia bacterium]